MPQPVDRHASPDAAQNPSAPDNADGTLTAELTKHLPAGPAFGPPTAPSEAGTLGPYRIIKLLGKGGMGAVYAAVDTRLNRRVALKVMLPHFAADRAARERFLREARAAAGVSHDNVVTVYEADERGGVPYIAMQFLEGYPLDEYLKKKGAPTLPQILRIARETAAGLAAAHRLGLIHRDVKPGNLWLEAPHGRVKVLDFGLAKPVDTDAELTKSGAIVGTPAYMSPEQARSEKLDPRADLFSLGAVLYRLSAGRLPFHGPTTMATLMALVTEEPPPVRELNPAVPEPLADLIHQLLAKNPADRPQSADEVMKRVRAIAEALFPTGQSAAPSQPQVVYVPIQVTALPAENPFADLDAAEAETVRSEPVPAPGPVRKKPGGSWLWPAVGFAAVLAVTVGGVIIIIKNKDGTETKIEVPDGATVTIKGKDGRTLAKVEPDAKPPVTAADPDRKAAEWVLSLGGFVWVNGETRDIRAAADLPKGAYTLTKVNLGGNTAVTDAGLAHLKDCKGLAVLDLYNTAVTDTGLAHLAGLTGLTALSLYNTAVTDAGLVHLKELKGLTYLNLSGTAVTDAGLAHLKDCKGVKKLHLSRTKVTDAGLANFKDCKGLTELRLAATAVTDAGLAHFKDCKGLAVLDLTGTAVTDAGLANFKDCKSLTELKLHITKVTDAGLAHFKDCKGLTYLHVGKTQVTAKAVAEFHAAVPGCQIEHDGGTIEAIDVDRKAAEYVVFLGGSVRVSGQDRDFKAAAELPKERFTLAWVVLPGTAVTDAGLACLKDCKGLALLDLGSTAVTDAGLAHLKDHKSLWCLKLPNTAVTDTGLASFKGSNGLTHLGLFGTALTDAGLAHFKDCKGLTYLHVGKTQVTAKAVAEFHAAVPGCKIVHDGGTIEAKK